MLKFKPISIVLFSTTLLVTFALHVHAGEHLDSPANVRGLVVSSGHGLIINDGVRDFILLGVDTSVYEGKICEAFGEISIANEMPTIKVETITIIADEYPDEDLVGKNRGRGAFCLERCRKGIQGSTMGSPGVAMPLLHLLDLRQRGTYGMRQFECDTVSLSAVACRSLYTNTIKE